MGLRRRVLWAIVATSGVAALGTGVAVGTNLTVGTRGRDLSAYPASKQAALKAIDQEVAAARAKQAAQPETPPAPPAPNVQPPRATGVIQTRQGPFSAAEFDVNSEWQGPDASKWLLLFAGSDRDPSGALSGVGSVRAYWLPLDPNLPDDLQFVGEYAATGSTGPLKVQSERGGVVTLVDTKGITFDFNTRSKTFG